VGRNGGSGVVILKYSNTITLSNPGGGLTYTTSTSVPGYKITTITAGTGNIQFEQVIPVEYLVVAGGGGGGAGRNNDSNGGGGGAGGYRTSAGTSGGGASAESSLNLNVGTAYTVTVGAGGAAGTFSPIANGGNGSNSVFSTITSTGGGGGGTRQGGTLSTGGSGGGGHGEGGTGGAAGAAGTANQGFAGGAGLGASPYTAGGGGGAGEAGNTDAQGFGGDGVVSTITGSSVTRGGGGGGSTNSGGPYLGGDGGGGNGGLNANGTPGSINTGGGGGGSSADTDRNGATGGSGVVVLRYSGGTRASGGTITTVGTDTVHTFTTSGTFTLFAEAEGLSADKTTAFWGDTITFTYGAAQADGATEAYTITGVTSAEINNASLTGNFTFTGGQASLTITLASLSTTNITTLVLTSGVTTISIPVTYVVSVVTSGTSMSWGESRTYTVNTRGLNTNTEIPYTLSGATSAQLAGASLSGNLTVTAVTQANTRGQYSVLFNGSTGYLSIPAGATFSFGTGDFTIECFMRTTNNTITDGGYSRSIMRIGNFDFYLRITATHGGTDGALRVDGLSDGSTVSLKDGIWHHIALVRESNTIRLWIDGVYQATGSGATYSTDHSNTDANIIGGRSNPINGYFDGHISNVRVVKGTALYTGTNNITVPTGGLPAVTGTSLLACRSSRIIDLSTNNHTITVNGTATVDTFNPVPTTFSNYFDGTGDYITVADNSAFELNADFTIEAFFYCQSLPGSGLFANIITKGASGVFQPYYVLINSSGILLFYSSSNGSSWNVANASSFGTVQIGRWHHVAVSRVGANLRLFLDGALITTITNGDALTDNNGAVTIGARSDGTEDKFVGWISNVRIVKGTGIYTAAFTVPTNPLAAIAGTSLLTCQSNRFRDASANNFTVTVAGNTAISSFNPLELASYSNYFDGTGDYLTLPYSASIAEWFNTDYTIEMWTYVVTPKSSARPLQVGYGTPTSTTTYWAFGTNTAGNIYFYYFNGAAVTNAVSSTTVIPNTWNHIAMVYNNSTSLLKGYINGVEAFSVAKSGSPQTASGYTLNIGRIHNVGYHGYISNLRITKGTRVYTSAFTPPNTALTAVTDTQLLTCRSNRFVDLSTNNITLTRTGDTKVDPFIPDIGFTPATTSPVGSATLTVNTNPSEPLINQATVTIAAAGTTRTLVVKTLGPNKFEVFKCGQLAIEYIDTEVTDVHAQGLEALVTTFASVVGILEPAKLTSGISGIEYIDTEVTDVHNENLEAKITTIAQLNTEQKPSILRSNLNGLVAAPTFAYSSGEDVKVSPLAVQTWYL
jgi:hypothetical protein